MARVLHLYNVLGLPTERSMLEVSLGLVSRGHAVTFACESVSAAAPPVSQAVQALERIQVAPTDDVAGQMEAIAAGEPGGAGADAGHFDLVHGHFGPRGLHASRWLVRGTPVILSCYGYDVSRLLRDPCWAARYRWLGEHGAVFVALSEAMREVLIGCGVPPEAVRLIRLGIKIERWAEVARSGPSPLQAAAQDRLPESPGVRGVPGVPRRLLFVGRFVEKKGLRVLLEAVALLRGRGVAAELDVIGGGDEAMPALARELGLAEAVTFHGYVPYEELPRWMRRAYAIVQPSVTAGDGDAEGCPMVLMQAQAAGTPAITTHHSGNAEALPPEARRFVVPERDAPALAEAIRALLELDAPAYARLRAAGRAWIAGRFEMRQTVAAYDALYRELASGRW